ncbi:MAG: Calx-beta domain-containing protein [Bacteroidota bacterium]
MKLFLLFLLVLACKQDYAQKMAIGSVIPNANAILDLSSGNKGLLIPRMDSVARKLIPNTKGLLVYDTTTSSLWHNDGSKWVNYYNIPKGNAAGDMMSWDGSKWILIPKGTAGQVFGVDNTGKVGWLAASTLSISHASVTEGIAGTVNLTFTVTKTVAYNKTVTVQYATANGTAIAGTDYTAANGTITLLPSELSKKIIILVMGDVTLEANEMLFLNLTNAVNATIADASGTGTIVNDD